MIWRTQGPFSRGQINLGMGRPPLGTYPKTEIDQECPITWLPGSSNLSMGRPISFWRKAPGPSGTSGPHGFKLGARTLEGPGSFFQGSKKTWAWNSLPPPSWGTYKISRGMRRKLIWRAQGPFSRSPKDLGMRRKWIGVYSVGKIWAWQGPPWGTYKNF